MNFKIILSPGSTLITFYHIQSFTQAMNYCCTALYKENNVWVVWRTKIYDENNSR